MPQYESLRRMLKKQYTNEEGTAVYDSYSGGILPREQVIAAFSRMNLSGNSWYVSTAMPYSKAVELQNNMLKRFGLLAATVLFLVIAGGTIIYHLLRNRQKLRLETKYLKEINSHPGGTAPEPGGGAPLPEADHHRHAGRGHRPRVQQSFDAHFGVFGVFGGTAGQKERVF